MDIMRGIFGVVSKKNCVFIAGPAFVLVKYHVLKGLEIAALPYRYDL